MRVILATNGSRAAASDRAAVRRRSDRQQGDVPRDRWRAGLRVRRPRAAHGHAARRAHLRPLHMLPLTAALPAHMHLRYVTTASSYSSQSLKLNKTTTNAF